MSRKSVVVCPGSGRVAGQYVQTKNPKVNCPYCAKRVGVMHSGKIRKHKAFRSVK